MHIGRLTHQIPPCFFFVVLCLELIDLHEALKPVEQL